MEKVGRRRRKWRNNNLRYILSQNLIHLSPGNEIGEKRKGELKINFVFSFLSRRFSLFFSRRKKRKKKNLSYQVQVKKERKA